MCLAALAWQGHPDWLLVVAANRDEYHARPAEPLARWREGILAGRDSVGGGTWLGVAEAGRFALVTNVRGHGEADPARASRGALVTDLLAGTGRYARPALADLAAFNPFNLIVAGGGGAHFLTNRPEPVHTMLTPGLYGLSNGTLDEPWPKTLQLKAALLGWLGAGGGDAAPLFAALRSEALQSVGLHPRQRSDIPGEPPDTPPFIADPIYGTRCSTVVTIDRSGRGRMVERRFAPGGGSEGDTEITFAWQT